VTGARRHLPVVTLIVCLTALYPLQRWIDASDDKARIEEEALYLANGTTVRRVALGHEALLADVYWMRSVQYFGRKVIEDATILNQRSDRLGLLYPLIDIVTDLDPRHTSAYRFGGFFVHDYVDKVKGFTILEKGVQNNPEVWSMSQDLAFLYWTDGRCKEASDTYARASKIPGAPAWMASLSATVLADCGDIATAREMYNHMLEGATDPRVVADLQRKLKEIQAYDEVSALRGAVAAYKERTGRFPSALGQVRSLVPPTAPRLRFDPSGNPLDPNGAAYHYDPATGYVGTNPGSMRLPEGLVYKKARG
jgi:hypothetical protein